VTVASAIMSVGVYFTRMGLRSAGLGPGWASLGIEVVAGGIAYVAAAFVVARPVAMDLTTQMRNIVARRRKKKTDGDADAAAKEKD